MLGVFVPLDKKHLSIMFSNVGMEVIELISRTSTPFDSYDGNADAKVKLCWWMLVSFLMEPLSTMEQIF